MKRLLALAVLGLVSCVNATVDNYEDKRTLAEYASVSITGSGDSPARLNSGSALEQSHTFAITASQPNNSTLRIVSSELILTIPAQQDAVRLSLPFMLNDFGMQLALRQAGSTDPWRELNNADSGFFTEILLDRALGAFSGTLRRFDKQEETVGEAFAVPQAELTRGGGDIELRIRMVPIDTWGDIGGQILPPIYRVEYEPSVTILDAEHELTFDEVEVATERLNNGRALRKIVGHYRENEHTLEVAFGFVDADQDSQPDLGTEQTLRISSTADGSAYRADVAVGVRSDGMFYAFEADDESVLPGDREGLRYLISYQLTDGLNAFRDHELSQDLWSVPSNFGTCASWGVVGALSISAAAFAIFALGGPIGAAVDVALVILLPAAIGLSVVACGVVSVVEAGGVLVDYAL